MVEMPETHGAVSGSPVASSARATIRAHFPRLPATAMPLELNQLRRLIDDLAERSESLRGFL